MQSIGILETAATRLEVEEMETLSKSVSPFELIQSNRSLGLKRGYHMGKYNAQMFEMACDYVHGAWKDMGHAMPSRAGLARYLGITKMTLSSWCENPTRPEMAVVLEVLLTEQELTCLNKGSTGEMASSIAKLLLAQYGYHDKSEIGGLGGGAIETRSWTTEIIDPVKLESDKVNASNTSSA